jgi:hypothetical protein
VNIAQGLLSFQVIEDSSHVLLTSFGGLPLVTETFRALGLPQSIPKHLPLQKRPGKYEEADYVESFISVFAAGEIISTIFSCCVKIRLCRSWG